MVLAQSFPSQLEKFWIVKFCRDIVKVVPCQLNHEGSAESMESAADVALFFKIYLVLWTALYEVL